MAQQIAHAGALTRAYRGLRLLELKVPDWRNRVVVELLDIECPRHCMLGQIFGDYVEGCKQLGLGTIHEVTEYGFLGYSPTDYKSVQAAWLEILSQVPERGAAAFRLAA